STTTPCPSTMNVPPSELQCLARWSSFFRYDGFCQAASGTSQPRPDSAYRHCSHFRDLAVFEPLNVAKHKRLPKLEWKRPDRRFKPSRIRFGNQLRLRCCPVQGILISTAFHQSAFSKAEIIDGDLRSQAIFPKPRIGGPAYDGQHPGPGVTTGKATDPAERAQARLLEDVFCVRPIACEPARKRKRVLKIGQDDTVKSRLLILADHD